MSHPAPRFARGKRHFAKGRLPAGTMNKTEARYEREVLAPRLMAGEIAWYCYEGVKVRLAPSTFLTVDFPILAADGVLEMIDVKGSPRIVEEDARVKMKVAADRFPFRFAYAFPVKGGGWRHEYINEIPTGDGQSPPLDAASEGESGKARREGIDSTLPASPNQTGGAK